MDAWQSDKHDEALALLKEAKDLAPASAEIPCLMGQVAVSAERWVEAIGYFEEAARKGGESEELTMLLSMCCEKGGQHDKAVGLLQSIPETSPFYLKALCALAQLFENTGRHELAIETLQRAPLTKRNLDDDLMEIHYRLGVLYKQVGNKRKALQHLRRVYMRDAGYGDVGQVMDSLGAA